MKAFLAGVSVATIIAFVAALVSVNVELSAQDVYQSHHGSVRLGGE